MADAVVIGNGTAAVRALRVLRECGISVPLVVADPRDTGADTWRESLVRAAREAGYLPGVSLLQPKNPNSPDVVERLLGLSPRVIFSVQCAAVLRPPLVSGERWWVVNWHSAPLPLLRGCDPFAWALLDGLTTMGVTLHLIEDEGIDSGPIVAQALWPVREDSTAWDLYGESLVQGEELLRSAAASIMERRLTPAPQEAQFSSYHPPGQIDFTDTGIRWSMPAKALSAWIRARIFPPLQMPWLTLRGERAEVRRCRVTRGRGPAGTVLSRSPLVVAAGTGAIELLEVGWRGEVMSGSNWAACTSLVDGEVLTGPR